jgi:hypothetical protein
LIRLFSAIELALLAAVAYWSWTWPRRPLQVRQHPSEVQ